MNARHLLGCIALTVGALISTPLTRAATIVDTGPGGGPGSLNLILGSSTGVGAEFSLTLPTTITDIQGWTSKTSPDAATIRIQIGADGGDAPASAPALFTAVSDPLPFGAAAPAWRGVSGLSWALAPGDYWVVFTAASNSLVMPSESPSPLGNEVAISGGVFTPFDDLDIGVRIFGTQVAAIPEPSTYALMLAGLGLVAYAARRRRTGA